MKKLLSDFSHYLLALLLAAPLVAAAAAQVHVNPADLEADGYALEMPPGVPMGAAYVALRNLSDDARILARVELPSHPEGKVEMHTTRQLDGVSQMRALKKIALPARGSIEMRPGATHLMVHGVALKAGDSLPLRLVFADGSVREMQLPVYSRERQKENSNHDAGHHHGHHDHG
ncbi:copper chaperone PCu(A)C [uncultured Microbulbifer sp.]|uniref:copper chaperone PCu(A)C n=1 Tax=uncultured Microbulbifer sp. TaxID=348147 RepID=UPI00262F76FD|nr:copper chaperone PCu(A)C [uncultured Microbulbifer sp.]